MGKHTILFLAANPFGTDRLALDEEARAIQVELERSGHRDHFEVVTRWAVQPLDLLRELRRLRPTVVHFSGHGGARGLYFQGSDGRAQPQVVSAAALKETFGAAGMSVRVVVLSACYSKMQADALMAHVDCVVGMTGSISDDAAKNFAIGFYGGLGECESVAAAFRQGCAAISLEGLPESSRPQLKVRGEIDAARIILAIPSVPRSSWAFADAPNRANEDGASSKGYEDFLTKIYHGLEADTRVQVFRRRRFVGSSGQNHVIDLGYEFEIFGVEYLTVIEAKCFQRKLDISDVTGFVCQLNDIKAHKGIMISTKGFGTRAQRVAVQNRVALIVHIPGKEHAVDRVLRSPAEVRNSDLAEMVSYSDMISVLIAEISTDMNSVYMNPLNLDDQ